jgi:hypothetical protein
MNAKQKTRWSKIRARGRRRFILVQGILQIGAPYAIISLIWRYFDRYGFTSSKLAGYLLEGEPLSDSSMIVYSLASVWDGYSGILASVILENKRRTMLKIAPLISGEA